MTTYTSFAPGRVEILGNHTDYNGGEVLAAALEMGVHVEGCRREGGGARLESEGMGAAVEFDSLDGLRPGGGWTDYPVGVAVTMRAAGLPVGGFEARYRSTLPAGAGLSSSAAIEVATAVLLARMNGFDPGPMETAKLCRRAENEFVGVQCGLLDQATSVFGRKGMLVHLDCRDESVRSVPFFEGFGFLIINSGVRHELTGGEYNERRAACHEAARLLGVGTLREATPEMLEAAGLPDLPARRARHVVGENRRVVEGLGAMERGDAEGFARLMTASHRSSMENFENSTPELDLLVELATAAGGCLGARLTGGGFGGAVVALVREESAEEVLRSVVEAYGRATGVETDGWFCRPADGAFAGS
jgi:galactokinase